MVKAKIRGESCALNAILIQDRISDGLLIVWRVFRAEPLLNYVGLTWESFVEQREYLQAHSLPHTVIVLSERLRTIALGERLHIPSHARAMASAQIATARKALGQPDDSPGVCISFDSLRELVGMARDLGIDCEGPLEAFFRTIGDIEQRAKIGPLNLMVDTPDIYDLPIEWQGDSL